MQPGGITTYFPFPGYEETVNGANTIKRSSYSFAGQTVATRVSGDPVSGNNGLFYVLSDHLGSTSMLVNSSGGTVPGSTTRNLPYGGYRGSAPTQTITDRGYTGHKQNDTLGLIYMNARYYVPTLNRFASADTIVPNPSNPQSYNRYSYVRNNPINLTDPTGHADAECSFIGECGAKGDAWMENIPGANEPEPLLPQVDEPEAGNWPAWTYSRWFPDYVTVQGNVGFLLVPFAPWLAPLNIGVTVDDYGNIYGSIGGGLGLPETVTGSIRAAGGWIIAAQEPSNFGVEWEGQLGGQNSPTEAELEDFLTGLSGALSGGYVVGVDVVSTISEDPLVVAGEFGVYTPQIGGGVSYSGLIYDNGSSNPWIWQKWEWFVDESEQGQ